MKKTKQVKNGITLIIEILLTLAICAGIAVNSLNGLTAEADQYTTEVEADYNTLIDSYVTQFEMIKVQVEEKIRENPDLDEMNRWLQDREEIFCRAIGEDVYYGFAMTYKGGYAHSWNYGDYTDYDPSSRPWYQTAQQADGEIAVVAPYVTFLDASLLEDGETILMTIAQKYNDEISFDYDLKLSGISSLLSDRKTIYSGTSVVMYDKEGYILSSTDRQMYSDNIHSPDEHLSRDLSSVLCDTAMSRGKLHMATIDGKTHLIYSADQENGNTICLLIPFEDIYTRNLRFPMLIAALLIIMECFLYLSSKRHLAELHARDERLSAITRAAFQWQVLIDLDTMTATMLSSGEVMPYQQFYESCVNMVTDAEEYRQAQEILSPDAIWRRKPGESLDSLRLTVQQVNKEDIMETRIQEVFLLVSQIGKKRVATLLCNDVTENEKEHQQILKSIASKFESVVVCNPETNQYEVVHAEPTFAGALVGNRGYEQGVRYICDVYVKPEYREAYLDAVSMDQAMKRLQTEKNYEVTIGLKSGHWISLSVIRCLGFEENPLIIQCVERVDFQMHQQEELRAALEAAEKAARAKSDFMSRMSHDMRTPMNGILGLAALMKDKKDIVQIQKDIEQLQLSGQYLLNLINDTLDMSKIESGKIELHPVPTNGEQLMRNVLFNAKMLTADKGQELKVSLPEEKNRLIALIADVSRIEQILMNLMSNAVKYTPAGGCIELSMEYISDNDEKVCYQFVVRDNGIGMSEEYLPHIFESFSQEGRSNVERQNGTGLGMSIVKQLVELMGGDLKIKSKINRGTEITLKLCCPRYHGSLDSIRDEEICLDVLDGKRILLCEDHPLNAQIAIRLLEKVGIQVEHVENGREGVETFEGSPEDYYDMILMDIRMPIVDGIEATRQIRAMERKDAKKIPIIAMTANAYDEDKKETLKAGMDDHISKPVDPRIMYNILAIHMKNR